MDTHTGKLRLCLLCADSVFDDDEWFQPFRRIYDLEDLRHFRDLSHEEIAAACRRADVVIIGRRSPKLPVALGKNPGNLRYICHLKGSIKGYVPKPILEAGVTVSNWGDTLGNVDEAALALVLTLLKQVPNTMHWAVTGEDVRIHQDYSTSFSRLTIGLYGFGNIARRLYRKVRGLGMAAAFYDPHAEGLPDDIRRCESLRELFATCPVISIHCGLNAQTQDSVTEELLNLLPQGGIVVNTARGGIVDEEALARLVRGRRLLAGLDVVRNEADFSKSPLAGLHGAVLTRHKLSSGKGFSPGKGPKPRVPDFVVHNLSAFAEGKPIHHVVPLEKYDLIT